LLGYIAQNKLFSATSARTLRSMKYCAIVLSILIAMGGLYIRIFHNKEDDPAGFLAMCIVLTFISVAIAAAVAMLEKIVQKTIAGKTEKND